MRCNAHGIEDCECYEMDLHKRIAELEVENKRLKQVLTDNWCYEKSELAALIGEE